ncbi:aminotransferase class V-fold PLP-dependent enzyme [Streptomyces sp. NBC_00237]|uniref:aminotransferase class V-fold PLP-dependent enzyme n=1 Tax=Streptomyces sp. NBC_00237 TaxID=2975687 RepID=UPI002250BFB2|nr:aminotransferase class V-fold PLP-dependent enzyme [Streptomyces sp. NBC_00237]MCX5205144.1 aminotransferase class V-fold PLP-dependent enzyme [Streptomyces sp. NBC_00237]
MTSPSAFPGGAELFRLGPSVAHLNHGSFGAVPTPVAETHRRLLDEAAADPDAFFLSAPDRTAEARTRIAHHLGTDPEGAALVTNATEAANLALDSLRWGPDDEILVTDHGYGTVVAAAARRARVVTVPLDPSLPDEEAVRKAVLAGVTPRTRVAVLDHISSPTARFIATPALLADLRERGVTTLVDGAHAPGALAEPLAGEPDFWFGNLHKWGYAPPGSALLTVAAPFRAHVPAPIPSWEEERGFPRSLEYRATVDYTGWLAAPEGLELLARLGPARVRRHNSTLVSYGAELLARIPGVVPLPYDDRLPMRSLRLPPGFARTSQESTALREEIAGRLGFRVLIWPWPGGGGIRISGQIYNTPKEYETLASALGTLLGTP